MTDMATAALPIDLGNGPFAVTTRGLAKRFGSVRALDGLDLQVPEGAVYVLVGPNGAGKSTLIRTLMGLVQYQAGTVNVLGRDPAGRGAEVRAGIGYVPEDYRVGYAWMTVGRLLEHHAVYHPSWDAEYARQLRARYEIDPGRKCHTLSKGQSRRVQLVLALAHRPPLLLLDEPTDGLDHVVRDETLSILSEHLADSPTTVVISTHRVYEVEPLVDHVGVLAEGRLLGQLPRDELHGGLLRYWAESRGAPVGLLCSARRSAPSARGVEGRAPLRRHPAVVTACRSPEARAPQGRGRMGLAPGDPGCGPRVGHAHGAG